MKVSITPVGCKIHDIQISDNLDCNKIPRSILGNEKETNRINNFFTINYGNNDKNHNLKWDVINSSNNTISLKNNHFLSGSIDRHIVLKGNKLIITDNFKHTNYLFHEKKLNIYTDKISKFFTKSNNTFQLNPTCNYSQQNNINEQITGFFNGNKSFKCLHSDFKQGFFGFVDNKNIFANISDKANRKENIVLTTKVKDQQKSLHIEQISYIKGNKSVNEFIFTPAGYKTLVHDKVDFSPLYFTGLLSYFKKMIVVISNFITSTFSNSKIAFFVFCISISSLSIPLLILNTYSKLSDIDTMNRLFMEYGGNREGFKNNFFTSKNNNRSFAVQTIISILEMVFNNIIPLWIMPKVIGENLDFSSISFFWMKDITMPEFCPWFCYVKQFTGGFLEINILSIITTFVVYNNFVQQIKNILPDNNNQTIKYILLFVIYIVFIKQQSVGYLLFLFFHLEYQNAIKDLIIHFIT